MIKALLLTLYTLLSASNSWAAGKSLSSADYLNIAFEGTPPAARMIWLSGKTREAYTRIMGHAPSRLRQAYWRSNQRSVWILETLGKEQLITAAFTIDDGRIHEARVLAYRESRGWEIQQDFFTRQFSDAALTEETRLDKRIDGITGATLSVRAMKRLARLALYLHQAMEAGS